ncbi:MULTISPECIES: 30S ribosomal protein S12 methylthiotransferase RimO [unclassified Flavonifractor]|uniref:30S ribosomal protein S12 methylthiotransferase RimO n=1 Tax=unclassified Flavonifractor TaxID=2629267 RepID=UPI000B36E0F3|nr:MULTISPECIES: 30S ribosomal protein S12 methylthiotransferase RimO [unclassified Flavonifractor]OUN14307.1 30S ribosomal protein S12 methylthiotransferase RimO [Flavonifractor sp. An91]OUN85796.1 30S ribosomal protein S12 methylthiotransferase RimO [Flavonifractor sp. An52]OUQ60957.1 30S ribosomal protein S12 methylthiotransferase RimO [Flavonifractor sp. An112]
MKIAFVSLGCAKNLVNTEQMMALVKAAGHTVTGDPEGADVAVLNTCGFIDSAKSEAIQNILELAALKDQGKLGKLLVAGCLTQRYRDEILEELPEIDGILGTGSYTDIVPAIESVMEGDTPTYFGDIDHTIEDGARIVSTPPYTAFLKIAEGCDNRCAYCVIPSLRGRYRSRTMESLLAEAKKLADDGVKELIVIAQDITRYGTDLYRKRMLPELLTELCKLPFHWVRLHYLYPDELDDALIDVIAREHKILKYIDIPLQHINDRILKAMNRRSTKAEIIALLKKLRERLPGLVLRTSLICGLPGETEEEFEELCDFLRESGIERAGIFQFSPEEGTPAAVMPDQVDPDTAKRRVELLVELQSRVMDAWNESRLGETLEVLCEGFDQEMGCYAGRSYADSPDVDGKVFFTAAGLVPAGTFVNVRITGTSDGDLTGEIEE